MPTESCRVSDVVPASPEQIFFAWLDGRLHTAMTGGTATGTGVVGSRFTAWDGYIEGTTLELEPGRRIVQAWRTSEFPPASPDSRIEVMLEPAVGGTSVVILHSEIPEGQGRQYQEGWQEHYLGPMKAYFGKAMKKSAPAKKSASAKKTASRKKAPAKRGKKASKPARKARRR
jgi:uncharacterized protein YndB with AHSA1/START domain